MSGCSGPIVEGRGLCCERFIVDEPELTLHKDMLIDLGEGYFSCNRWDKETRLCTRYEERPAMCREFPGKDRACTSCGLNVTERPRKQNADKD